MNSLLVYVRQKTEEKDIIALYKDSFINLRDEDLDLIRLCEQERPWEQIVSLSPPSQAIIDLTALDGLELAMKVRAKYPHVEIMVIADAAISPNTYLTPQIRAVSLLLRPFNKQLIKKTIHDFVKQFCVDDMGIEGDVYLIRKRGEEIHLPCMQIYYIEARDKKVHIYCETKEYIIYEKIDALLEKMPKYIKRAHRSFLVNKRHIRTINYRQYDHFR